MGSRAFSLCRSLCTGGKQTLAFFLSRSYTVSSSSAASVSSPFFSRLSLSRVRPLAAIAHSIHGISPVTVGGGSYRAFATRQTQSSLNDSSPNWSNRPPKETILLDGCDFEHWLVVTEKPDENMTRDEIIDMYIETLAKVVGSKEEARMKIYSVSTKHYFAFGALVSEELSYKLKELPNVRWVLPDSYLDVKNKDYGGEPFINGQAVPYDPMYHEEWVRNNAKAMERNRRNDRPRNFDRSRNFERRRQNMQSQGPPMPNQMQNPSPNMRGPLPPPNNLGGPMPPPNYMGGSMPPPNNMGRPGPMGGGMPPNNMGGPGPMGGGMPPNMGGPGSMGVGGMPHNTGSGPGLMGGMHPNMGGMHPNNMGGMHPNNMSGGASYNMGGGAPPNMGGGPHVGGMPPNTNLGGSGGPNMGGYSNPGWQGQGGNMPNYQIGGGYPQHQADPAQSYQGNHSGGSNNGLAGSPYGGDPYQGQRDMPPPPPPNYHQ